MKTQPRTCTLPKLAIIYDNECPACRFYTQILNVKENIGDATLINARDKSHPLIQTVEKLGLDLNKGFVLKIDDQLYHGADAIWKLSLLGSHSTFISKLNYWIFRSSFRSKLLYPVLTLGRKLLLFVLVGNQSAYK